MTISESDQILFIDTENEDEQKDFTVDDDEDEDDRKGSHFSDCSDDEPRLQSKPNSLNAPWPKSYRKSMDLFGSVGSTSLNFMGSPNLSPSGGSFFSSSLTRRHTPEVIPNLGKPLLEGVANNQQPQERRSSHSLLPPSRSSAKTLSQYQNSSLVSQEPPVSRQSSFGQAVVNGVNLLCGVGLLSTPYAVKEGGWVGLSILFIFCVLCFYTGILLRYCLDSRPGLETYPDIGEAAFGMAGRLVISIVLYVELYASCVEFIIMQSDNLSSLFPNAHLNLGGYELSSHYLFAIMITLVVLPTVWLRNMSILSYVSAGGVFVSFLLVICLFWVGLVDNIGFHTESTTILNLSTLPVSIGLYGYCYAGHAVLPNIYTSMENRSQYTPVLLSSFAICTVLYAGVAVMGYVMFGESTDSQFTLNLPADLLASKIAVWSTHRTYCIFLTRRTYALTISPVALSLEELIPSNHLKSHVYSILIRTVLVISTLLVALSVPFFGLVMSVIGSILSMLVSLIFPCACFLRILKGNVTRFQGSTCILIIVIGIVSLSFGSYTAISEIVQQLF